MRPYYEADGITIFHGDCREILPHVTADVIVTDPPYGIAWKQGDYAGPGKRSGRFEHGGIQNDASTDARDAVLLAWHPRPAVAFGAPLLPAPANTRQVLVWRKPGGSGVVGSTTGFRRDVEFVYLLGDWPVRPAAWSSVLAPHARGMVDLGRNNGHPHSKPVPLMRTLIDRCPQGVVLDPFMGSGSTLVAARDLGRRAIGIELEERYCEIAATRLGQMVLDMGEAA